MVGELLVDKLSREGHRERMRKSYITDEMENSEDYRILELFISGVIPRKDVKQIAYDLMNAFNGSLENIVNAPVERLMSVDGVGEVLAVELKLISTINKRIDKNKNTAVQSIKTVDEAVAYFKNLLSNEKNEIVYLLMLDDMGKVLGCHRLSKGSVNESYVSKRDAVSIALAENATNVILAHNHPNSTSAPSGADINTTINMRKVFREVSITLLEHIIIGTDGATLLFKSQGIK